ncbi:serine hydrolase domain-containing protein [Fulvivirga sedimenti]|uniref:Beta-lactamase family protein n=1 Tax=Fulvivirga sedimenti TaxID=2879465 RepID=A0A9X1HXN6_9BACT|nr:serine hydrolase domain-containing protein [Fulvivirga sedimenti]MCA6078367.1 beta-lactamase family protein [Fulvivirga sedimenti]
MRKQSKRILKILIPILVIAGSLYFIPWKILWVWASPRSGTVQEQVNDAVDFGFDGIIVYVDQGNREPEFYAAGWKNRENKIPADPHALFKIASISKLYIAVATTKLIVADSLHLDDTLADLLPEYAGRIENSKSITLRMLLQHRSGIPNFLDDPDFPWDDLPKTNLEMLAFVLDDPADFPPDEKYSYSNTNYLLIGEILDKTLGYSHHVYIKNEILEPLGLNNTYSLLSEVNPDDVMSGYFVGYEYDIKLNDYTCPGGSMVATIDDVGKFLRALNNGTLLNDPEQEVYSSVYEFGHTGLLPGYQSIARYHKDIDAVVIQFVNTSGGETWTTSEMVYNRILEILRNGQG